MKKRIGGIAIGDAVTVVGIAGILAFVWYLRRKSEAREKLERKALIQIPSAVPSAFRASFTSPVEFQLKRS